MDWHCIEYCRMFIPNKVILLRPHDRPLFNNTLRRLQRKTKHLFTNAKSTVNEYHWHQYNRINNEYKGKLKESKYAYYKKKNEFLAFSQNSKKCWRTENDVLGRGNSNSYPPIFNEENNSFVSDNSLKANLFCKFSCLIMKLIHPMQSFHPYSPTIMRLT